MHSNGTTAAAECPAKPKGRGARAAGRHGTPMCEVLVFPLARRIAKVRRTAEQLKARATERHSTFYRQQVTEALQAQLERAGIPADECAKQLELFWRAVAAEMAHRSGRASR